MDLRGAALFAGVLGAAVLGASTACSGPDPGSITFTERGSGSTSDTSPSSSTSTTDGGGSTTPTADPIFGTTAFKYEDPGQTANNASSAHNGTVVGKDCAQSTQCHASGGAGPTWTFAGTLYASGGTTTIAKGEVMVVDSTGKEVGHAFTDANGNFWYQGGALPAGAKAGARADGVATIQHMATALTATNTGCNSASSNCHGTATQGPIHVP